MLPVLAHNGRQIEVVVLDLGAGLREWIEIRNGDDRTYCATAIERDAVLANCGLSLDDFAEADSLDDGCE